MDDTDTKRQQRARESYLVAIGAIVGILASTLQNMFKDLLTGQTTTYLQDFLAGILAVIVLYLPLRVMYQRWRESPTKINSKTTLSSS